MKPCYKHTTTHTHTYTDADADADADAHAQRLYVTWSEKLLSITYIQRDREKEEERRKRCVKRCVFVDQKLVKKMSRYREILGLKLV